MNEERVRIITASIREQDAEIESLKNQLKDAKEQREETLQQLLAEIERRDDQQELKFPAGEKKAEDAEFEVVDDKNPKQLEPHNPLAIPEGTVTP